VFIVYGFIDNDLHLADFHERGWHEAPPPPEVYPWIFPKYSG
jgi:hypothetical protein